MNLGNARDGAACSRSSRTGSPTSGCWPAARDGPSRALGLAGAVFGPLPARDGRFVFPAGPRPGRVPGPGDLLTPWPARPRTRSPRASLSGVSRRVSATWWPAPGPLAAWLPAHGRPGAGRSRMSVLLGRSWPCRCSPGLAGRTGAGPFPKLRGLLVTSGSGIGAPRRVAFPGGGCRNTLRYASARRDCADSEGGSLAADHEEVPGDAAGEHPESAGTSRTSGRRSCPSSRGDS